MFKSSFKLISAACLMTIAADANAIIADAPKPSVVFEEDFSLFPGPDTDPWNKKRYPAFTSDQKMKDEFFHTPGWKGWYISYGQFAGVAHFEYDDESDTGYIQTPPVNLTADGGKVTITVEYRLDTWEGQKTKTDNIHIQLRDRTNGTDTGITGIYSKEGTAEVNTEWGSHTVTLTGGTADCSVRIWGGSYTGDIRNIKILQVLPDIEVPIANTFTDFTGDSFTANWRTVDNIDCYLLSVFTLDGQTRDYLIQDKELNTTSYKLTNLDPQKTYYYSVKSRKGNLTSDESNLIRCFDVPCPEAPVLSDVTTDGFHVSWAAPYNANTYQLETTLVHTATAPERYCLLDEDFLNTPCQYASPDEAMRTQSTYLDDFTNRANYYISNPKFAQDCITLDNTFASMGAYGELDGPTMDLSADGGKVTIELRVRAINAASMGLYMLHAVERENQFTSDKIVDRIELWDNDNLEPLTEEWTNRTFTLKGGNEKSYIAIQAYGYGAEVQIDHIAIYQNLAAGETIRVPYRSNVTYDTEIDIHTNGEGFSESRDQFECTLMGAYVPTDDNEDITYSDWSDIASIRIPGENAGLADIEANTGLAVSCSGKTITVTNPAKSAVTVYSLSGVAVYTSTADSFTTPQLASGIYFVSAPGFKTLKVAL